MKEDRLTTADVMVGIANNMINLGKGFYAVYSVSDIGGMSSPDDTITLSWKTPDTPNLIHLGFKAICTSGALVKLIRGKTGGGASPTGIITVRNHDDGSSKTSGIWNLAATPAQGSVSYDATLFTGGATLIEEYMPGSGDIVPAEAGGCSEIILARNTFYQLSILETGNVPATLKMCWYELTGRNT